MWCGWPSWGGRCGDDGESHAPGQRPSGWSGGPPAAGRQPETGARRGCSACSADKTGSGCRTRNVGRFVRALRPTGAANHPARPHATDSGGRGGAVGGRECGPHARGCGPLSGVVSRKVGRSLGCSGSEVVMAGKRTPTGIVRRHGRACRSRAGGGCNCSPAYEAWLSIRRDGRYAKVRKTFSGEGAFEAAKAWRADAAVAARTGALVRTRPDRRTLADALERVAGRPRRRSGATAWTSGIQAGDQAGLSPTHGPLPQAVAPGSDEGRRDPARRRAGVVRRPPGRGSRSRDRREHSLPPSDFLPPPRAARRSRGQPGVAP